MRIGAWLGLVFGSGVVTLAPALAGPLDISLSAKAEVRAIAGLDPETRALVEGLPKEIRVQMLIAMNATFDRADRSVLAYVAAVDNLMTRQLSNVQCATIATAGGAVDAIKKRLFGSANGPLKSLQDEKASQLATLGPESTVTDVIAIQADIGQTAVILKCTVGPPAYAVEGTKVLEDMNGRFLVWNRISGLGCVTVASCLPAYRDTVEKMVASADRRDSKTANGPAMLQNVVYPEKGGFLAPSPGFVSYEAALTDLFQIENSVGSARARREASALSGLLAASAQVTAADAAIKSALATAKSGIAAENKKRSTKTCRVPLPKPFGDMPLPCPDPPLSTSCTAQYSALSKTALKGPKAQLDKAAALQAAARETAAVFTEEDAQLASDISRTRAKLAPATGCK